MFRRTKTAVPAAPTGREPSRYVTTPVIECLPDVASNARLDAITNMTARQLQGHSGLVVGYDRGDPTRTLTGAIKGTQSPTNAQARVYASGAGSAKPVMTYQDTPGNDPTMDPYKSQLWSRMVSS